MNVQEIRDRIAAIQSKDGERDTDEAMWHLREDELYEEFVRFVAAQAHEPLASLAKEILQTKNLPFSRWYE